MHTAQQKEVLTTGEVATICHVAPRTVSKWFDTGKLRGYRIPGSRDRRIPLEHLIAFMRAHGIPLNGLDGGICRVLVVNSSMPSELAEVMNSSSRYDVRTAANGFEAGVLAQQLHPHVIVLDVGHSAAEALTMCRDIKANETLRGIRVIAVGKELDDPRRQSLIDAGFDQCLSRPYTMAELIEAIQDATNFVK